MSMIRMLVTATLIAACACSTTTVVHERHDDPAPPPLPVFYDELDPHGDWWWNEDYGWVWSPDVSMGWRPYTVGHWAWTDDAGWMWMSHEPYGSVVFHYGRWIWMDDVGWVWIPGRVWGPAWVAWRTGPGFIGWGPLGPHAVWVNGRGFIVTDVEVGITPWGWVFVEERHYLEPDCSVVILPRSRNDMVLPSTRVTHRPEHEDGRVVNRGVPHDDVARVTGRPVPRTSTSAERVQRRPDAEHSERDGTREPTRDPSSSRERPPRDEDAELRPLRTHDDDVERRYEDERRRAVERQDVERKNPPPGVSPDELPRRHDSELKGIDREKERDKQAQQKRKTTAKKTPKKKARPSK
jgi:hypothetical protein